MTSQTRNVVVDRDLGQAAILAEIEKLSNSYVKIGLLSRAVSHHETKVNSTSGDVRTKVGGQSLAQIGIDNEYGTQRNGRNIPPRPFVSSTYDENRERLIRILGREHDKIIAGESTVFKSLSAIGIYVTGLIQKKIQSIHTPPNSPVTIALKGSSHPLIDFGQMIQAISYEVVIQ